MVFVFTRHIRGHKPLEFIPLFPSMTTIIIIIIINIRGLSLPSVIHSFTINFTSIDGDRQWSNWINASIPANSIIVHILHHFLSFVRYRLHKLFVHIFRRVIISKILSSPSHVRDSCCWLSIYTHTHTLFRNTKNEWWMDVHRNLGDTRWCGGGGLAFLNWNYSLMSSSIPGASFFSHPPSSPPDALFHPVDHTIIIFPIICHHHWLLIYLIFLL